ncbi:hypothetical protein [Vibrio sp. AND4]|uniref:hypothetical protein n=1 Tax=Vibrio sp. AND4 TaxID=314289 RepID=UPI00015F2FC1|nr:hypothetical protein [Vibrio sp. AND4]EDP60609.1 hypothetical protein AND4_06814 [Vibrio sp. AND4]
MKKCLLALTLVSLNSFGANVSVSWTGVVPPIAPVPSNITVEQETVHYELHGKQVKLSVTDLLDGPIIITGSDIPTLALNL